MTCKEEGSDVTIGGSSSSSAFAEDLGPASMTEDKATSLVPINEGFSLAHAFYDAYRTYSKCLRSPDRQVPQPTELDSLLDQLKAIAWHVDQLHVFSPNEELDDINTTDLKFLLVPYMLAEASAATQDMQHRLEALKVALIYWRTFIHSIESLNVAHDEDLRALNRSSDETPSASDRRTEKIERYRRCKELDNKAEYWMAKKRLALGDEFQWGSGGAFDEDMERELIMALLKRAVAQTVEDMASTHEEIKMLEIMMARGGPGVGPPLSAASPPDKKPWFVQIQDRAELQKLYLEQVFQSPVPLPTMTLAEAADIEIRQVRDRQEREAARARDAQADDADRWYDGDRYGSKEDEEEEHKLYKDRWWDEWKEENPYGCGNKMANLG